MNREDFPILKNDIIYFDNGATTLKPKCVIDKITDYYENYSANAHRGDYDISFKVDMEYEKSRDLVKNFINAKSKEEVVFTSGTTDSLNMIASGFFANLLEAGDEILITTSEHASNILPWFRLSKDLGCIVNFIPLDESLHVTLDNVRKSITLNTKVIALAGITNVVGDIRPIKEITKLAHEHNIFVVVDGAQMVPHLKTDVQDLDIDFLAFSGHKMCGPTGVGVLYGKYHLLEEMTPTRFGGGSNARYNSCGLVKLKNAPTKFETGTPNIEGVIGLGSAIEYLQNIGMKNIEEQIGEKFDKAYLDASLPAAALYEKLGFVTVMHERYPVENGVILAYEVMEKELHKISTDINYDGRKFIPKMNSENGEVGEQTNFTYHQNGNLLWAEYSGGDILKGSLIGTVLCNGELDFVYHHMNQNMQIKTGKCHSVPTVQENGKIELSEQWQWTSGDYSKGESLLVEV